MGGNSPFESVARRQFKKIILEETILLGSSPTPSLDFRKELHAEILGYLKQFTSGGRSPNILLYGPKGTGKTTLAKTLASELNKTGATTVYANCWQNYTVMSIYSLIAKAIGDPVQPRGLAAYEVLQRLIKTTETTKQKVVIFLDDVDGLIFNKQQRLLKELANAGGEKQLFCFMAICDDSHGFTEVDKQRKLDMHLKEVQDKPYTEQEIEKIIESKAKLALASGSFDNAVIRACAQKSAINNGNIKIGLEMLWTAALTAEAKNQERITIETTLQTSSQELTKSNRVEILNPDLSQEERLIVSILARGAASSSNLYDQFQNNMMRTKRQIRNYLKVLAARKIISVTENPDSAYFFRPRIFRLYSTRPI